MGPDFRPGFQHMSHLIVKGIDQVFAPATGLFAETWHNLHSPLEGGILRDGSNVMAALRPIVQSGFRCDFSAPVSNVPEELAAELGENPLTDWKILLADLREDAKGVFPVHVCKHSYTVHQNKDLFENALAALDCILGAGNYEIATVGTLGAYSQFFLSVFIKGESLATVGQGDEHRFFFNVVSSHNSLVSTGFHLGAVRIVCMNTVRASLADADGSGLQSVIRHSVNSGEKITSEAMGANLKEWMESKRRFLASMERARAVAMDAQGFRHFAAGVFTREDSDCISSTSTNRVEEMVSLFSRGRGNHGKSLYDGLNAFTEYFTHGAGLGRTSSAAKRLASANFGRGNDWKLEAIRCAEEDAFEDTLKRGERFWNDREKVAIVSN